MKIKLHISDFKSSSKGNDNRDDDNDNKLPVFLLLEGQFCWQGVLGQTHLDSESFQILKWKSENKRDHDIIDEKSSQASISWLCSVCVWSEKS